MVACLLIAHIVKDEVLDNLEQTDPKLVHS